MMTIYPLGQRFDQPAWRIVSPTEDLLKCNEALGGSPLGTVAIIPTAYLPDCCHHNADNYAREIAGNPIKGFYWLGWSGGFIAIRHSIVATPDGGYVDPTPCYNGMTERLFSAALSSPHPYGVIFGK